MVLLLFEALSGLKVKFPKSQLVGVNDGINPQVHGLIVVVIKEYRSDKELFNSINLNIMIRREINCKVRVFKG